MNVKAMKDNAKGSWVGGSALIFVAASSQGFEHTNIVAAIVALVCGIGLLLAAITFLNRAISELEKENVELRKKTAHVAQEKSDG